MQLSGLLDVSVSLTQETAIYTDVLENAGLPCAP